MGPWEVAWSPEGAPILVGCGPWYVASAGVRGSGGCRGRWHRWHGGFMSANSPLVGKPTCRILWGRGRSGARGLLHRTSTLIILCCSFACLDSASATPRPSGHVPGFLPEIVNDRIGIVISSAALPPSDPRSSSNRDMEMTRGVRPGSLASLPAPAHRLGTD